MTKLPIFVEYQACPPGRACGFILEQRDRRIGNHILHHSTGRWREREREGGRVRESEREWLWNVFLAECGIRLVRQHLAVDHDGDGKACCRAWGGHKQQK